MPQRETYLVLPRVYLIRQHNNFAKSSPNLRGQIMLPEPVNFTEFDGIPKAWYSNTYPTLSRASSITWPFDEEISDDLISYF